VYACKEKNQTASAAAKNSLPPIFLSQKIEYAAEKNAGKP